MASMKPVLRICLLIAFAWTAAPSMRSASAADVSGLEGQWTGEQANSNQPAPVAATLIFTQGPGTLTGIMRVGAEEMPLFDVKESGTTISFTLVIPGAPYVSVHYIGARAGDEIRMVSSEEGHGVYTMTAHRDGQTQTASLRPAAPRAAPPPQVQRPPPLPPPPPATDVAPLATAANAHGRLAWPLANLPPPSGNRTAHTHPLPPRGPSSPPAYAPPGPQGPGSGGPDADRRLAAAVAGCAVKKPREPAFEGLGEPRKTRHRH